MQSFYVSWGDDAVKILSAQEDRAELKAEEDSVRVENMDRQMPSPVTLAVISLGEQLQGLSDRDATSEGATDAVLSLVPR